MGLRLIPGVIQNETVFSQFITGYESSKTSESMITENNGKKYTKKERKVAGTK